jgi:hypothetical protein
MDLLFRHKQEKKEKVNVSFCDIHITYDGVNLNLTLNFNFNYTNLSTITKKQLIFNHSLSINTNNGNVETVYKINNDDDLVDKKYYKNCEIRRKNSFKHVNDLLWNGLERGEKRLGYWGTQYKRANNNIFNIFKTILLTKFTPPTHKDKEDYSEMYELLVDFHLSKKNIKGHDHIYDDLMYHYPTKKWLTKNNNKYLPAVLDSLGIKTSYLISEINKSEKQLKISSINYLCKLFGNNFTDYLKSTPWQRHCYVELTKKTIPEPLKNDYEKKQLSSLIKNWEDDVETYEPLIYSLAEIFKVRKYLDEKNIETKFTANKQIKFNLLKEEWIGLKEHNSRGYKNKYLFPKEFIDEVEDDIIINGKTFKVKILKSEDDFRVEGAVMKNCMARQFIHGLVYIYLSMSNYKTKINLQYRKGDLVQALSKTNKPIHLDFTDAVDILNEKMVKHKDIVWKKERYDFL